MLKIKWIGQSGYIVTDGITTICIDPYLSDVVNRVAGRARMVEPAVVPEMLCTDVVVCTHNHLDHVDIDAIPLMNKQNMLFLAPIDAKKQLNECGVTNYCRFDEGDVYNVGGFELIAVFADHSVPAIGVILKHNDVSLYFSGDTEYNKKLEELAQYKIDVMFICINGKLGNMNVYDAIRLTKAINPRVAVPSHYGMFASNTEDPEKFTSAVNGGFEMEYNIEYDIGEVLL